MKKFIITEEEKKNILSMYSILTEEIMGMQKLDVSKYVGKTYKLYLEPGSKSTKFEWIVSPKELTSPPTPASFLPAGKNYFEVKINGINYFSGNTELNYSFLCDPIETPSEEYSIVTMYTDSKLLPQSKFHVTVNYYTPKTKAKYSNEVFYGYSDELRTDLNNNGIK
jgi:hypothetical protein